MKGLGLIQVARVPFTTLAIEGYDLLFAHGRDACT